MGHEWEGKAQEGGRAERLRRGEGEGQEGGRLRRGWQGDRLGTRDYL